MQYSSLFHCVWLATRQGVPEVSPRDVCFVPGQNLLLLRHYHSLKDLSRLFFSLSLSFFLPFSLLSDTNKRITEKERHVEYYACVHVVKKQNRKEVFLTLAWIVTRGCYHGNADSTTVEGRYLPHLVFQGKGMPYLSSWHTICDPCLLFPFSIVYSRHNTCRYMYVTIKIENLEVYTFTGQRMYLRNISDST